MNFISKITQDEEGSALATVLVISVIITLLIGLILAGIVLQTRFIQREINSTKALYAAEAGLYEFLNSSFEGIDEGTFSSVQKDGGKMDIETSRFGGLWDIKSKAVIQTQTRKIRVLVGDKSSLDFENAIMLKDSSSALTLTWNANITGDVSLAKFGVRTNSLKGFAFRGKKEGDTIIRKPGESFLGLRTAHFDQQKEYFDYLFQSGQLERFKTRYSGDQRFMPQKGDTLYFDEDTEWVTRDPVDLPSDLIIIAKGNVLLNGPYQFGSFTKLIVSDTLLVGGSVTGTELLIYAGKSVQIGGGTDIGAQVLSGGTIIVRDNAYLKYPSLLYSFKELYSGGDEEVIRLRDNAIIDGSVIYPYSTSSFTQNLFRVKVDSNATVRGSIYSNGQTELEGKVYGSVLTNQFYFYENPTDYINWIRDAEIDVTNRPKQFVIPVGFSDSLKYQVVNWFEVTE